MTATWWQRRIAGPVTAPKPARRRRFVLAVAMMGFLNKFMDAMGIPLEDRMWREQPRTALSRLSRTRSPWRAGSRRVARVIRWDCG